jgi:hypothetical protein
MADNGWSDGICPAEPGLLKLLLLSLGRIGVVDPPKYTYREHNFRGTLRCDLMIFVGKSTLYPNVDPWFISTTGFGFPHTYRKAARKALRRLRVVYRHHLQRTPMGFFPPAGGRGRSWIAQMRGLGREEEELEDTVSHLSIYLTGLDRLYSEQIKQLKHQIRRAEKVEQELEIQCRRAIEAEAQAESSLASLRDIWRSNAQERERIKVHRREAGLLEGEPEETRWDKSTQTEEEVLEQCLPPKKRPNRIGEGFPWGE